MNVYVVTTRTTIDYEGSSDEIYGIYESEDDAREVVTNFQKNGPHSSDGIYSYDYFYSVYLVQPKTKP